MLGDIYGSIVFDADEKQKKSPQFQLGCVPVLGP
jgi:hypothetical protein